MNNYCALLTMLLIAVTCNNLQSSDPQLNFAVNNLLAHSQSNTINANEANPSMYYPTNSYQDSVQQGDAYSSSSNHNMVYTQNNFQDYGNPSGGYQTNFDLNIMYPYYAFPVNNQNNNPTQASNQQNTNLQANNFNQNSQQTTPFYNNPQQTNTFENNNQQNSMFFTSPSPQNNAHLNPTNTFYNDHSSSNMFYNSPNPTNTNQGTSTTTSATEFQTKSYVYPQVINNLINPTRQSQCLVPNSYWNGYECVCRVGFYYSNNNCILSCPLNFVNNGFGSCVCRDGFILINGFCQPNRSNPSVPTNPINPSVPNIPVNPSVPSNPSAPYNPTNPPIAPNPSIPCPAQSVFINGQCQCRAGLFLVSNTCQRCPSGSLWSSQSSRCIYVCGLYAVYNTAQRACQCIQGYGRGQNNVCQICPLNFYVSNGFCVTCTINSNYNSTLKQCICQQGYRINLNGLCQLKCLPTQVYNTTEGRCACARNFAIGPTGSCQPCPLTSQIINQRCVTCPQNSFKSGQSCICNQGYIRNSNGVCVYCTQMPNHYILNTQCITCPSNQIYNNFQNKCQCPSGKQLVGIKCQSICGSDELIDQLGNCYMCGLNQVISNGACQCVRGFKKRTNGCGCEADCANGQFQFNGQCAFCPLNTVYFKDIKGCVCPQGFYLNSVSNLCTRSPFVQPKITCLSNQYLSSNRTCLNCSVNCRQCKSATQCLVCLVGYAVTDGICGTVCGDGVIRGSEQCDAGIFPSSGCIRCQLVRGYVCQGQPSVCVPVALPPSQNRIQIVGTPMVNSNNIFLVFKTTPTFTFPNENVMQSFIQLDFDISMRPAYYCNQQQSPNLDRFNCLLIYPSGVPNRDFNVRSSFNYQGRSASTSVAVDPLKTLNNRNTRARPRVL